MIHFQGFILKSVIKRFERLRLGCSLHQAVSLCIQNWPLLGRQDGFLLDARTCFSMKRKHRSQPRPMLTSDLVDIAEISVNEDKESEEADHVGRTHLKATTRSSIYRCRFPCSCAAPPFRDGPSGPANRWRSCRKRVSAGARHVDVSSGFQFFVATSHS